MPRQLFIRCSLLLLLPSFLAAQHQARMLAPPARSFARPVSVPASANAIVHRPSPVGVPSRALGAGHRAAPTPSRSHHSRSQFSPRAFDDQFSDFPVPGLGFDAVHFAATHPNASNHRHRGSNFLIPLYGGEYFYPYPVAEENPSQTSSQTMDDQDNDVTAEDRPSPGRRRATEVAPALIPMPEQTIEPSHNSDEYIFVRRDGSVFFAVAYSWDRRTLRYINQQGLRQSLSSDSLDLDATHQFNEQRGLAFRPPA